MEQYEFGSVKFRLPVDTANRTRLMVHFLCRSCNYNGNHSELRRSAMLIDIAGSCSIEERRKDFSVGH